MSSPCEYLRFSVSLVQSCIESARTVRDLWTGSYLISWLTARGAAEVLKSGGELFDQHLANSPLVEWFLSQSPRDDDSRLLRSSLPNVFFARISARSGLTGAWLMECVHSEWMKICEDVKKALHETIRGAQFAEGLGEDWDEGWSESLNWYWDFRTQVVSASELASIRGYEQAPEDESLLAVRTLSRIAEAVKLVRHIRPAAPSGEPFPPTSAFDRVEGKAVRRAQEGPQQCFQFRQILRLNPKLEDGFLTAASVSLQQQNHGFAPGGNRDVVAGYVETHGAPPPCQRKKDGGAPSPVIERRSRLESRAMCRR